MIFPNYVFYPFLLWIKPNNTPTYVEYPKTKCTNFNNPFRFNPVRKRGVTYKNASLRCSYDPSLFVSRARTIPFPVFGCTICSSIRVVCYQDDIIMGLYTDQSGVIEMESVWSWWLIVSGNWCMSWRQK